MRYEHLPASVEGPRSRLWPSIVRLVFVTVLMCGCWAGCSSDQPPAAKKVVHPDIFMLAHLSKEPTEDRTIEARTKEGELRYWSGESVLDLSDIELDSIYARETSYGQGRAVRFRVKDSSIAPFNASIRRRYSDILGVMVEGIVIYETSSGGELPRDLEVPQMTTSAAEQLATILRRGGLRESDREVLATQPIRDSVTDKPPNAPSSRR